MIRATVFAWIWRRRGANNDSGVTEGCMVVDSRFVYAFGGRENTRVLRVQKQASLSPIDGGYELSEKLSTLMDLQRICCGVSFSIKAIVPPQCGQSQEHRGPGSEAVGLADGSSFQ